MSTSANTSAGTTGASLSLSQKAMSQLPLWAYGAARTILTVSCLASLAVTLHPDARASIRAALLGDARTVVSTVKGDLLGDGSELTVAKVKTRNAMLLEVYQPLASGTQRLLGRIDLSDKRDGYFNFNGQATNLALEDVDGDGQLEILAAGFDQHLVGKLHVFSYDKDAKGFQRVMR